MGFGRLWLGLPHVANAVRMSGCARAFPFCVGCVGGCWGGGVVPTSVGKCPFRTDKAKAIDRSNKQNSIDLATLHMDPDFSSPVFNHDTGITLMNLLIGLLQKDPSKRLGRDGAAQVKAHRWFKDVDWSKAVQRKVCGARVLCVHMLALSCPPHSNHCRTRLCRSRHRSSPLQT